MNEATFQAARMALCSLANDVIRVLSQSGREVVTFRGIAFYDTCKDDVVIQLPSFDAACEAIRILPMIEARYGSDSAPRLALQWIYQLLPRLSELSLEDAIDGLWEDFLEELDEPQWTFRGVANLRHLTADADAVALGPLDGVTVRGRSFDALRSLGFGQVILDALAQDWDGFGASSYVLVAEKRIDKHPENLVQSGEASLWVSSVRLLGAMRLAGPGDVSMGQMWLVRPMRFNIGIGGHSRTGWSIPAPPGGSTYNHTGELVSRIRELYSNLLYLDQHGYSQGPGNLDLALRSFMATYDRWPAGADSQLIDSITAAEAVLGTETEITFRLAFRMAGILADGAAERGRVFQALRSFYDTRSKLVHGGALKPKHRKTLDEVPELRNYVRRLLEAFVRLTASGSSTYNRKFFTEQLDLVLQDEEARKRLRSDLGL